MINELKTAYRLQKVPFNLMQQLSKISKSAAPAYLARLADSHDNHLSDDK